LTLVYQIDLDVTRLVLLECSGFGAANVPNTYASAISSTLGGQRESAAGPPEV
jgi:hypothetical protein